MHRVLDGLRREVGGARVAVLLAEIDGHAEALVPVVLDRLDLAAADGDALPVAFGDLGLGVARAAVARELERVGDDRAQCVDREGEARIGHGVAGTVRRARSGALLEAARSTPRCPTTKHQARRSASRRCLPYKRSASGW